MASGQGYIEMQNPKLVPHIVGSPLSARRHQLTSLTTTDNKRPKERYAMFAEVYGPFHEDSMELKEEIAYQRGMMAHIHESMEGLSKLRLFPDHLDQAHDYPNQTVNYDDSSDKFQAWEGSQETVKTEHGDEQWPGNMDSGVQSRETELTEHFCSPYKPKLTYLEIDQKSSRRPLPWPPKTYAEIMKAPKTYSEMSSKGKEQANWPAQSMSYAPISQPHFGTSLTGRWNATNPSSARP